ncbi:hypothetical protein E3U23_13180 [Erythrobacter litoralis]|uniref:hypothetical protein n=1 Tax=Erythrobacter litoralis TaxID=39960 RepID=UPI002435FA3E|nr:hypothetical protein [Erythrobacter litoralis]MDG6080141.1 hypothetical protein [Erythrobacter litoralis]
MGLLLLLVTGILVGWLTTIALRIEDGGEIGRTVAFGAAGSVIVGFAVSSGMVLGSVTAIALLAGLLGAAVFVALFVFVRRRRTAV